MITIGVVDDKIVNRKTVQRNISPSGEIKIVLEANNGSEFLEKMEGLLPANRPQVVLMDIEMPVMNGIEAIAVGTLKFPNTRFLVLTVFDDDERIFEAIRAGAGGYLLKDDPATVLTDAITEVLTFNGAPMSPAIARKTMNWLKDLPRPSSANKASADILSEREIEIVKLMVDGNDYKSIASRLFISPNTVRVHITKIYEKLHVNSKAQAIQMAHKYKWV